MRRHVFAPLGMHHSDYECSERVREHLAASLKTKRGRRVQAGYPGISPGPAGSVYSTLDDLALYLVALMNGGANELGRVLRPQTLRLMMAPHVTLDERLIRMGLGFMVEDVDSHHAVGHPGGLPWFASAMLLAPSDRVGVILLTNTYDDMLMAVARKMLRCLLAVPPRAASLPVADVHANADDLRGLTGFYGPQPGLLTNLRFWGAWGGEVQVYVRGDKLYMRSILPVGIAGRGLRLHPADRSDPLYFCAFFKDGDVPVVFGHDNTGRITTLCIGPFFALTRRSTMQSLHVRILIALSALLGAAVATAVLRHTRLSALSDLKRCKARGGRRDRLAAGSSS